MKAKATTMLLSALLLAAIVGVGYAMWSETLRVNITVNTGEVDVEFSNWSCNDVGIDPGKDKDVASCSVVAEDWDDEGDVIKLLVTIENGYPCYYANITLTIDNIGTVPVKLYNHYFEGLESLPLEADLVIPEDTQIDPDGHKDFMLNIHILQDAEELASYSFELTMEFAQWNEVPGPS